MSHKTTEWREAIWPPNKGKRVKVNTTVDENLIHYAEYVQGRETECVTFDVTKVTCEICLRWLEDKAGGTDLDG